MSKLTSPETENGVLGTCLNLIGQKIGWFNRLASVTHEPGDLFADPRNRAIHSVMERFYKNDKEPTIQQIVDQLDSKHGGLFETTSARDYVTQLSMNYGTIFNSDQFDQSVETLNETRKVRAQINDIEKLLGDVRDPREELSSSDVAQSLQNIVEGTDIEEGTKTFGDIVRDVKDSEAPTWRIPTGIQRLDQVLGGKGIEAGTLITIGARPKVGKTVLMNSLTHTILENGGRPVVLNLETKPIEFVAKSLARHAVYEFEEEVTDFNYEINELGNKTRKPNPEEQFTWSTIKDYLSKDNDNNGDPTDVGTVSYSRGIKLEYEKIIEKCLDWAENQDWFVSFQKDMTMAGIEQLIKKEKERNVESPKIVLLVDYVQLQVTNSEREREQITDLTRFYKKLAGKYNIAVVILAQINREGTDDPQVEHLKSSGSLEQDSDVVLLLSQAQRGGEIVPNHIKINGKTTRLGQPDIFNVFFDHSLNLVAEASRDREEAGDSDSIGDVLKDGEGIESVRKGNYQQNS